MLRPIAAVSPCVLDGRPTVNHHIVADVDSHMAHWPWGVISAGKDVTDNCSSTEGFVDFARIVEGVDVAVLVKYAGDELTRISMRSKQTDVAAVAEKIGGGGHVRAAGCTLKMSFEKAKEKIISAIIDGMMEK